MYQFEFSIQVRNKYYELVYFRIQQPIILQSKFFNQFFISIKIDLDHTNCVEFDYNSFCLQTNFSFIVIY